MFPLQQIGEDQINQEDLVFFEASPPLDIITNINNNNNNNTFCNKNILEKEDNNNSHEIHEYDKLKKMEHRDMERQRRHEMATLQASLRSLLPPPFTKEKSSISDHIHQAKNYIKHLQSNIEGLHAKRGELMMTEEESNPEHESRKPVVVINRFDGGLEILISANVKEKGSLLIPLSIVLSMLMEERVNPISCISSKHNERCLWRIQCEVNYEAGVIEVCELQRKISDLVITKFI